MAQDRQSTSVVVSGSDRAGGFSGFIKSRKWQLLIGLVVLFIAGTVLFLVIYRGQEQPIAEQTSVHDADNALAQTGKLIQNGNISEALDYARDALAEAPDDLDLIMTTADLAEKAGASDTAQLYSRALAVFKSQSQPDKDDNQPGVYMAAGMLAEKAGLVDEARQYYRQALKVANPSNSDEANIIAQANTAIERLQ